ncbi:hypothetical protein KI614_08695 [Dechloromonas denitrificans]|uniref:hypothetical protein n=1 Tax=Dechloromonas denitrificans TaxID=281362 RepID=UPI001CF92E5B|nr:hypothetical protein [Dechloromonas denitrificans]UCV10295.1 hypothetical protein KI614_08695 [Dechloromonas denitrificans]
MIRVSGLSKTNADHNKSLFAALQHKTYIAAINFVSCKEITMSLTEIIAQLNRFKSAKQAEVMSYADVFEADAGAPVVSIGKTTPYLPGMRMVENDVDAYFKEVFAGPVF